MLICYAVDKMDSLTSSMLATISVPPINERIITVYKRINDGLDVEMLYRAGKRRIFNLIPNRMYMYNWVEITEVVTDDITHETYEVNFFDQQNFIFKDKPPAEPWQVILYYLRKFHTQIDIFVRRAIMVRKRKDEVASNGKEQTAPEESVKQEVTSGILKNQADFFADKTALVGGKVGFTVEFQRHFNMLKVDVGLWLPVPIEDPKQLSQLIQEGKTDHPMVKNLVQIQSNIISMLQDQTIAKINDINREFHLASYSSTNGQKI